jgi:hypothetical protein
VAQLVPTTINANINRRVALHQDNRESHLNQNNNNNNGSQTPHRYSLEE